MSITPYLRPLTVALLFACGAPLAMAAPAEGDYDAGVQAAQDLNYSQALQHFLQAAEQGHPAALRSAGLMLMYGERLYGSQVRRDEAAAMRLLRRAAGLGCEVSTTIIKQHRTTQRG